MDGWEAAETPTAIEAAPSPLRLLTPQEVCDLLRVTGPTLLKYRREGKIACVRLPGGHVRYRSEHVEAFIDRHVEVR